MSCSIPAAIAAMDTTDDQIILKQKVPFTPVQKGKSCVTGISNQTRLIFKTYSNSKCGSARFLHRGESENHSDLILIIPKINIFRQSFKS